MLTVNHNLMAANAARTLSSHYRKLETSVQRLSSGLRVNSAADDAAGLAIRELQRADIATLYQGMRNANDAISLIQTADGALSVIDEKLIRMKELAEQAATGTYNSTQRLMIESEYQAMASEITRIANATDFNGIKLLDGTLSGAHDGSGLTSTGSLKVHFGCGNDSAEDYYYITIGDCTAGALGVGNEAVTIQPRTKAIYLSPDGDELTPIMDYVSLDGKPYAPIIRPAYITPVYTDDTGLLFAERVDHADQLTGAYYSIQYGWDYTPKGSINEYTIAYNGQRKQAYVDQGGIFPLQFLVVDSAVYEDANGNTFAPADVKKVEVEIGGAQTFYSAAYTVSTQEAAQLALTGINNAIEAKDKIRAHLGALQNRLENTVTNLSIQAENLQAAESRISDTDVATEMTTFVRNQILTQSAVAMLSQANSLPQMALQLIGG